MVAISHEPSEGGASWPSLTVAIQKTLWLFPMMLDAQRDLLMSLTSLLGEKGWPAATAFPPCSQTKCLLLSKAGFGALG